MPSIFISSIIFLATSPKEVPVCQIKFKSLLANSEILSFIDSFIVRAPKLPPTTKIVILPLFTPNIFFPSSLLSLKFKITFLIGFPVNIILSLGKNLSILS